MSLFLAADLLSPNLGLIFWTGLAFGLLLFLLGKYAWGPITAALEEREKTIEESITRAERALAEARQMQDANEAARRDAERQAREILGRAHEDAEGRKEQEKLQLKAELDRMRQQAVADIEQSTRQAQQALRTEMADLVVAATGKLLAENLDDERQHRLAERFIAELPAN